MNFSKSVTMDVGFYDGQEIPIEAVEEYEEAVKLIAALYAIADWSTNVRNLPTLMAADTFLEQTDVKLFLEHENGQASKTQTKAQTKT